MAVAISAYGGIGSMSAASVTIPEGGFNVSAEELEAAKKAMLASLGIAQEARQTDTVLKDISDRTCLGVETQGTRFALQECADKNEFVAEAVRFSMDEVHKHIDKDGYLHAFTDTKMDMILDPNPTLDNQKTSDMLHAIYENNIVDTDHVTGNIGIDMIGSIQTVKAAAETELKYGDQMRASVADMQKIRTELEECKKIDDPVEQREEMLSIINDISRRVLDCTRSEMQMIGNIEQQASQVIVQKGLVVSSHMQMAAEKSLPAVSVELDNNGIKETATIVQLDGQYYDPYMPQRTGDHMLIIRDEAGRLNLNILSEQQASVYVRTDVGMLLSESQQNEQGMLATRTRSEMVELAKATAAYINAPQEQKQIGEEIEKGKIMAGFDLSNVSNDLGKSRDQMMQGLDSMVTRAYSGKEFKYMDPQAYVKILRDGTDYVPAIGAVANPFTRNPMQLSDVNLVYDNKAVYFEMEASNGSRFEVQYDMEGREAVPKALYHNGEQIMSLTDAGRTEVMQKIVDCLKEDLTMDERDREDVER